jgi:hypothetical protein
VPETLASIRQMLSRLQGETIVNTPTGTYATTTFACSALTVYSNDYFNDLFGRFYDGTHMGENFVISDFVKSTGVSTFAPAVTLATNSSDKFEIYPQGYTPQEFIDAINLAISSARTLALIDHEDASIETKASTYVYDIPPEFAYIEHVLLEQGTADRYSFSGDRIDIRHWRILPGDPPQLWIDSNYNTLTADRQLRLLGQRAQDPLVKDDDLCLIDLDYMVNQAKANLHFARTEEMDDAHHRKMVIAQARADDIKDRIFVGSRGRSV